MNEDKQGLAAPAFGVALDPFRPHDIQTPPGVSGRPPICPSITCLANQEQIVYFLYINNSNAKGDVLLTCLNCGYETVFRVSTGAYEPRPGRDAAQWNPPVLDLKLAKKIAAGKASVPVAQKAVVTSAVQLNAMLLTIKEAAAQAKKTPDTMYEAIRLGRLKATKKDGKVTLKQKDLALYLRKYPARG